MSGLDNYMLPCLNKTLFGVECPGCGMQRSLALVSQGQFTAAYNMYPAIYTLFVLALFLVFNLFVKFKHDYKIKMGLIILNVVIVVVSYVFKITHLN